jgi:hypothetical protein
MVSWFRVVDSGTFSIVSKREGIEHFVINFSDNLFGYPFP